MKRIFWGLVKIGIIIGLLVWVAQEFFPVSTNQEKAQIDATTEKLIEGKTALPEVSIKKETIKISPVERGAEPITFQQKQYALYSEKSGIPDAFTAELTFRGTEPISTQLARAFDEPPGEWRNFSVHSKTFWVLAELTFQDVNIDVARSWNGAILTVKNGSVSIDMSEVSIMYFSMPTFIASSTSFTSIPVEAGKIENPLPSKKTMRRMSGRSWQQVLETGARRGVFKER